MQNLIFSKLDLLPEFLTSNNLVDLGLYNSIDAAYAARVNGKSPDFLQFRRKILYPKASVVQFVEKHMHLCNSGTKESSLQISEQNNNM
jgi:hypothetical protein